MVSLARVCALTLLLGTAQGARITVNATAAEAGGKEGEAIGWCSNKCEGKEGTHVFTNLNAYSSPFTGCKSAEWFSRKCTNSGKFEYIKGSSMADCLTRNGQPEKADKVDPVITQNDGWLCKEDCGGTRVVRFSGTDGPCWQIT